MAVLVMVLLPLPGTASDFPHDAEVKVALQSVLVAVASTVAGQTLSPPLSFAESTIVSDEMRSFVTLDLHEADIGALRLAVLTSPPPPPAPPKGILEAMMESMVSMKPNYGKLVEFLKPQALGTGEVFMTGTIEASLNASLYPIRYEGSATLQTWGSRFRFPISLVFRFIIPMEGPYMSVIIPIEVFANGYDFLAVGQTLFPLPRL